METAEYMSSNPVTFTPDTDIFDAIHVILEHRLSGATVLNENKEVVGVISELDCLKAIINVGYYRQGGGRVADFMCTESIQFMPEHTNIIDAAQMLITNGHRRMPVERNGQFIGQISARSLLQALKDSVAAHEDSEDALSGVD
jgi:FOG: CBS domain